MTTELIQLNHQQFERFSEFIYAKSGIHVPDNKVSLLSNRIRRRLKVCRIDDFDVYYRHLVNSPRAGELGHFLDSITTNETFFFRTPHHFEWFTTDFIKEVVEKQQRGIRSKTLRVWSAACATGEEPYSIAICLRENHYRLRDWELTILGSDISEAVLTRAREGIFKPRAVEALNEKRLRRNFMPAGPDECWQIRNELKEMTRFERHNLMDAMPQPMFDCIFIRNVLIYFDRTSKQTVVDNLIARLAPGGYLVVGASEGIYDLVEPLNQCRTFLYRKPGEVT